MMKRLAQCLFMWTWSSFLESFKVDHERDKVESLSLLSFVELVDERSLLVVLCIERLENLHILPLSVFALLFGQTSFFLKLLCDWSFEWSYDCFPQDIFPCSCWLLDLVFIISELWYLLLTLTHHALVHWRVELRFTMSYPFCLADSSLISIR